LNDDKNGQAAAICGSSAQDQTGFASGIVPTERRGPQSARSHHDGISRNDIENMRQRA